MEDIFEGNLTQPRDWIMGALILLLLFACSNACGGDYRTTSMNQDLLPPFHHRHGDILSVIV